MSNQAQWKPKTDCLFFSGEKPCREHKKDLRSCADCDLYTPVKRQLLIDCQTFDELPLFVLNFINKYQQYEFFLLTKKTIAGIPSNSSVVSPSSLEDYLLLRATSLETVYQIDTGELVKRAVTLEELFSIDEGRSHNEYDDHDIIIIKTGAAGDVLRTTPILRRIRENFPYRKITWITKFPRFVPSQWVDQVIAFDWISCLALINHSANWVINLDKQKGESALASLIPASHKDGFIINHLGKTISTNDQAKNKWLTGLFDQLMKNNSKSYLDEIFEVIGYSYRGEKYILDTKNRRHYPNNGYKRIALNIGAGTQWRETRLWPRKHYRSLALSLLRQGYEVELLGGDLEHEDNLMLSQETGAIYRGVGDYDTFIKRLSMCDILVTSVTMALHVALALEKRVVLFNNIFNKEEFYLFGLGQILQPKVQCVGCYKSQYDKNCEVNSCMDLIAPTEVEKAVKKECALLDDEIVSLSWVK